MANHARPCFRPSLSVAVVPRPVCGAGSAFWHPNPTSASPSQPVPEPKISTPPRVRRPARSSPPPRRPCGCTTPPDSPLSSPPSPFSFPVPSPSPSPSPLAAPLGIMADKKSDDFVVRVPDAPSLTNGAAERGRFSPPRHAAGSTTSLLRSLESSGGISVLAYCLSSISMTLVNKYVVSGNSWNLHLLYLAIQVSNTAARGRRRADGRSRLSAPPPLSRVSSWA